jgi:hypothetical protein
MLRGGLAGEHAFADKALSHVLTDDNEYLAKLVGADGASASLSSFVSSP